ncbi:hypothetical protein EN802_13580 [bacterium M00.F.Ca.ET.159.01.1.1]|nr:hypothetical protein EN802_13580 [bacterium M00.F.Ca.ET.159.01.1.1]
MIASKQALGAAFTQVDSKISQSGDGLAKLSRIYLDGYKNQERFEQGLRQISRQLDAGKTDIDGATRLLIGMGQKLGVTADASVLMAQGQVQLAAAVGAANVQLESQIALIERARAEQAAENSRQIAAANQNKVNGLLGVGVAPVGAATASAGVFEAEFARLDLIAQQKAAQIGRNFGEDLETSLVVGARKSARDAANVFEAELDRIDQIAALKAQQAGGYFQQDLNASFGIGRPTKSAQASASVFEDAPAEGGGFRLNRIGRMELQASGINAFQALASGMGPGRVAQMEGAQIIGAFIQGSEGGVSGALNNIKTGVVDATKATVAFLSTTAGIATGFGLAAAAAGAFYLLTRDRAKSLDEALKSNKQAITDVADAYGIAGLKADDFGKKSKDASAAELRTSAADLQKSADEKGRDAVALLNRVVVPGRSYGQATLGEFAAFDDPIQKLSASVRAGHPDFDAFDKSLQDIVDKNPGVGGIRDKILGIVSAAEQAWRELQKTNGVLDALSKIRLPEKGILPKGAAGDELAAETLAAQYRMGQQFSADALSLNARSPAELAAAARARVALNPSGTAAEQATREDLAGKKALLEAEHQINIAEEQRRRSILQTVDAAKLDADSVFATTAAVETAKFASQQLAQIREEAARNGITSEADIQRYYGKSIELIKQQAIEYGKLIAVQQARSTIHQQDQELEVMRAEVGLVGASRLEHDRQIASLKAEQQIRELGIPLYGKEAEQIRANTAELAALNEQMAKAKIQQDLLFDIRQAGRSEADQSVASQLRDAGLPEDLNSDIAKVIKMRDEIARMKDTWNEVFQTARDGIDGVVDALFNGGSISDALKIAGRQLARTLFDQAITNPLKNWLTGSNLNTIADLGIFGNGAASGRGGGFGGVLGNLLGAQKAVASMQVQAASVFINGAPLGIPGIGSVGSILGGKGSAFTPNTTLTDILTGGSAPANQNYIQSRIDQAFGTSGLFSQDQIQNRINGAFGAASPLGGIFTPSGGFANVLGGGRGAASLTGGGGVAGQVWNFFASKGLKPFQIAGIMGNVSGESAFNPLAVGDGGNALGLFQWNDRAPALLNSIGGRGNLGNVGAQLNFAWKELQTTENTALQKLMSSTDVRGATSAFAGFERPEGFSWANPEGAHNFLGRLSGAQDALAKFGSTASTATSAVGQLGGASSGALSSLVSSTGQAAGGLNALGSGAGKLGSMLSQFPAAPGGGGGGFGGIGGLFGSLFGGGGLNSAFSGTAAYSFLSANPGGYIGLYADGTESAPPGWAWVGEKGPELRKLRAGDVIRSNPRSAAMMRDLGASNDNAGSGGGTSLTPDHIHALVDSISKKLSLTAKIINLDDPNRLGDYLDTPSGEQKIMNVLRRNGK